MKTTQINSANLSISLVYCLFGILSFFVLKIAAKYFTNNNLQKDIMQGKKIVRKDVAKLNFSRIYLETYFLKSTLIGSIFNKDKKYLIRQMLSLSCIAVSCFKINSYIMWPWTIGLSVFVATLIISQFIIPALLNEKIITLTNDNESLSELSKNQLQIIDLNSIQIEHTQLQLSISTRKQVTLSKNYPKQIKKERSIKQKAQLIFIAVIATISGILISQCIVTLSLSVSNSGVLNFISIGIAVLIDQLIARTALGLASYTACIVLQKTEVINFFENRIFVSFCHQAIFKQIQKIQTERKNEEMKNKIANINKPNIDEQLSDNQRQVQIHEVSTQMKMFHPSVFQQVSDQITLQKPVNLQVDALLQESQQSQEEEDLPQVQHQTPQKDQNYYYSKENQLQEVKIVKSGSQTNIFQFFAFDLEMFDESKANQINKVQKKILKKKLYRTQQKFKSDPHLYFPYEEHKSSHRDSINHQSKQNYDRIHFSRQKSSIQDDYIRSIDNIHLDFINDVSFQEEPQIGTVLNEKNLNIKTLVVNRLPQIPPTSRPAYSNTKRQNQNEKLAMKKMKKVSPYLVNLSSQAIRPLKLKKIQVSKNNKENANQTNKSSMASEVNSMS